MSLYRSQSSPQGAKRFRMNSSYHDAPYSRDHRSFRFSHDGLCNICKRPGHFARDCPNMTVCNNCGLPGHISAGCNSDTVCYCVGTARSLDTMLAIAPMIQSAIHVVRWATLLASAVTLIFQFIMQVSATIDIGQATLLLTAEIRRPATTAGKLVILLVIALMSQSATYAIYQVMWPVNVPSQARH